MVMVVVVIVVVRKTQFLPTHPAFGTTVRVDPVGIFCLIRVPGLSCGVAFTFSHYDAVPYITILQYVVVAPSSGVTQWYFA